MPHSLSGGRVAGRLCGSEYAYAGFALLPARDRGRAMASTTLIDRSPADPGRADGKIALVG